MIEQGGLSLQRTAGMFLVLGFGTMLVGALMWMNRNMSWGRIVQYKAYITWERSFIIAAVCLTVIGLMLLARILHGTDGHVLARVGASTYLIGAVPLVVAEAIRLSEGQGPYPLNVIYVVLAFLGQAAIGGALLQFNLFPAWVGWGTLLWNPGLLVVLPVTTPGDIYFPIQHHLMPLLIGSFLLWRG